MSSRGTCFCIFPSKSLRKQQGSEDTTVVMVDYVLINTFSYTNIRSATLTVL